MTLVDEEREAALIYQNLSWSWSFYGLQLMHFTIAGGLTMVVFFFALLFGINMLYGIAFFVAALAALAAIQWRKPPDYISDMLNLLVSPRRLDALRDDELTWEFPVPREDLRHAP